jgi:hypothetical protein
VVFLPETIKNFFDFKFDATSLFPIDNPIFRGVDLLSHFINPKIYKFHNIALGQFKKLFPEVYGFLVDAFGYGNYLLKYLGPSMPICNIFIYLSANPNYSVANFAHSTLQFQQERFADSFTTIYGYAPAGISASKKLDELTQLTKEKGSSSINDDISWVGAEAFRIFAMIIDPHPENQTRAKMMLEDMKKLSENKDFPPTIRKQVKANYEVSKKMYDNFIKVNDDVSRARLLKLSRQFKETYLGGKIDLRSYILTGSAIYG